MKEKIISSFLFLSFLNVSLAGHFRNDVPPNVRIFEIRPAETTKLDVGETEHIIEKPPNSNLIVGEDIQSDSKLVLECDAKYPVQWVYQGDGTPEYSTNTTTTKANNNGIMINTRPSSLFIASISLGFRRPIGAQDSGKYTCRSLQNADLSVYYYLYVTGQRIFTSPGGEDVYYKRSDPFVTIPCSVSNPKATVSLQKSINGLVQCPLNESITYDVAKGFQLKVSSYFDPQGTYVCTGGYNDTFEVVRYNLIPEVSSPPAPEKLGHCQKNGDCRDNEACLQSRDGYICTSPCSFVCGRNTQCDVISHVPRCGCLPGYQGDAYKACFASVPVPDRIEQQNPCHRNPCGRDATCTVGGGNTPICSCAPGFQGDPYVRCYQSNACDPNPCGANSNCAHRNGYTSCSCKPGYYGQPPYCRAECEVDNHCPSDRACIYGRCRNPCDGACQHFSNTQCRVIRRQAVCARIQTRCPVGYYGPNCQSIYTKVDAIVPVKEDTDETTTACSPFPCGKGAECTVQTVKNTALNTTSSIALCSCPPKMTGNADIQCWSLDEQVERSRDSELSEKLENSANLTSTNNNTLICRPDCGENAVCGEKNVCSCQSNYKGNPYTKCTPVFCTTTANCDSPNATCISGKCTEKNDVSSVESKGCGINAISVVPEALGKVSEAICVCPAGYTGIASIECHNLIDTQKYNETNNVEVNRTDSNICSQNPYPCGVNTRCTTSAGNVTICECIKSFEGDPLIGCERNCTTNDDCPSHYLCHDQSHRCIDPCEKQYQPFFTPCGRDAKCKVLNHTPACYCPDDLPHGSPLIHCKEKGWMPNHRVSNSSCQNEKSLSCGPSSSCKRFHDSKEYCICNPGFFGDPLSETGCKLGLQCKRDTHCNAEEECMNGKCLNVCRKKNTCGDNSGCKAENHKASCICHIGTILNPKGDCEPAKGALAERLLFFRSFEDV